MSRFDLWTIPKTVKLNKLSSSFVDYFNANHTPLLDFEALLPYFIDHPYLLSKQYLNFDNEEIRALVDFIVNKGYLEHVEVTDNAIPFRKTGKHISVEDVSVFGSLCYTLISRHIDTSKLSGLSIFSKDVLDSERDDYRNFISDGRSRGAIKGKEFNKMFNEFHGNSGMNPILKQNFIISDKDKEKLTQLITEIYEYIPNDNKPYGGIDLFLTNINENSALANYKVLFKEVINQPFYDKIQPQVNDLIQQYTDIVLKSSKPYTILNMQHAMDIDVYDKFSNEDIEELLSEKNKGLMALEGQLVSKQSLVATYIAKLKDFQKSVSKYERDLDTIKKSYVKLPEQEKLVDPDIVNLQSDNEYTRLLEKKHRLEKQVEQTDVEAVKNRSIRNYVSDYINKALETLKSPITSDLQTDISKANNILDDSRDTMKQAQMILKNFNESKTTMIERLYAGIMGLYNLYKEHLTRNNISASEFDFKSFVKETLKDKDDKSSHSYRLLNSLNNELDIVVFKLNKNVKEVDTMVDTFNNKYKKVTDSEEDAKNNIDVLVAGLKYLTSSDQDKKGNTDYFDIDDIVSGYDESNRDNIRKYIGEMQFKMDNLRDTAVGLASQKFSESRENINKQLEEINLKRSRPQVQVEDSTEPLKLSKNLEDMTPEEITKELGIELEDPESYESLRDRVYKNLGIKPPKTEDDIKIDKVQEDAIKENNKRKRIDLGKKFKELHDTILNDNTLKDDELNYLAYIMNNEINSYSDYRKGDNLDKYESGVNKLEDAYNKIKNKVNRTSSFDNYLKLITAGTEFTVNDFNTLFEAIETKRVEDNTNPTAAYYVSYVTTISQLLIEYLMLNNKAIKESDVDKYFDSLVSEIERNPRILNTLPFETTVDYLKTKSKEIKNQINYILFKNFNYNLSKFGTIKGLAKKIIEGNKDLNITLAENTEYPYNVVGVYSPEEYAKFLSDKNLDKSVMLNTINNGTLIVCDALFIKYVKEIGEKLGFDSLYYKSITEIKDDLIFELLNLFKAVVLKDDKITLDANESGSFLNDILLPRFDSYLQNNKKLKTADECLMMVNRSKRYGKEPENLQHQYANFYVMKNIKSAIFDFYRSYSDIQYMFSLKADISLNPNDVNTAKKVFDGNIYVPTELKTKALQSAGLFSPDGTIENTDANKLIILSQNYLQDPSEKLYGGKARITTTGPFSAWNRILRTYTSTYKLTSLMYVEQVLNDIGCTTKYLDNVDAFVRTKLKMSDSERSTFENSMEIIKSKHSDLKSSLKIIDSDLTNINAFAKSIINSDEILSKYVYFEEDSFNLDLGTFKYRIDEKKILDDAKEFKNEDEVNKIQLTMKGIIKGLKLADSNKVADLLSRSEQIYNLMLNTTNVPVTKAKVEERLIQFNKILHNYIAQLHQDFIKFKSVCQNLLDALDVYTSLFIEVIERDENSEQYNLLYTK